MENEDRQKIHQAVEHEISKDKFGGTSYWDWFRLVKSLNLGHRPTREETNEVLCHSLVLMYPEEVAAYLKRKRLVN